MEEAREELDEFQLSSRELEAELEAQLEQAEGKNKELLSANGRLTMEVEMLRVSPCFSILQRRALLLSSSLQTFSSFPLTLCMQPIHGDKLLIWL